MPRPSPDPTHAVAYLRYSTDRKDYHQVRYLTHRLVYDLGVKLPTAICALLAVAACAAESPRDITSEAQAALQSPDAAERYEAVVRLGTQMPSEGSSRLLMTALRDKDEAVRLMAAIAIVAQGATDALPSAVEATRQSSTPNPQRVPDGELDPMDRLVYVDPWLGGTFLPGLLAAARDEDDRVRTLAHRAMRSLHGPRDFRTSVGTLRERAR